VGDWRTAFSGIKLDSDDIGLNSSWAVVSGSDVRGVFFFQAEAKGSDVAGILIYILLETQKEAKTLHPFYTSEQ
jgi:hypothetical protein